jgi:hypothetical protein
MVYLYYYGEPGSHVAVQGEKENPAIRSSQVFEPVRVQLCNHPMVLIERVMVILHRAYVDGTWMALNGFNSMIKVRVYRVMMKNLSTTLPTYLIHSYAQTTVLSFHKTPNIALHSCSHVCLSQQLLPQRYVIFVVYIGVVV